MATRTTIEFLYHDTSQQVLRGEVSAEDLQRLLAPDAPAWIDVHDLMAWDESERGFFPVVPATDDAVTTRPARLRAEHVLRVIELEPADTQRPDARRRWPALLDELERFFEQKLVEPHLLHQEVPIRDAVNLDLAVEAVIGDVPARLIGIGDGYFNRGALANAFSRSSPTEVVRVGPPDWDRLATSLEEQRDCLARGVRLVEFEAGRVAIGVITEGSYRESRTLEVMALDPDLARSVLEGIREEMITRNTYRGKVVRLRSAGLESKIEFQRVAETEREDIVLPEDVLESAEHGALSIGRHRDRLLANGQHLSRGMLFHGMPGTGKTLTARYLLSRLPGHTVVVLSGDGADQVGDALQLAQVLSPSVVLIEDVDLIARQRQENPVPKLLNEMLDFMDGIAPKVEILFLLTTNQPEVLEPALASRPGRIDQVIEFPVPGDAERRRLFELYSRTAPIEADVPSFIERCRGASGAFIQELIRRAYLFACDEDQPVIGDAHLDRALQELIEVGGELTHSLLGFHRPGESAG